MSLLDVIKYEVTDKELVCKYPSNNIRLGSQLVVYPAQTALFIKNGKIYDEFLSGTYTVKSENIPLLDKILNIPFGSDSPFQVEVWFVNQVSLLNRKWGTATPLQIEDPQYEIIVPVRAFGQYGFHIANPRLFLERLVGNMSSFTTEKLDDFFRGIILSKLTSILYEGLNETKRSVLTINAQTEELSNYAKTRIEEDFAAYGIEIETFNIISVSVREDDASFQRLKEAKDAAAKIKIIGQSNYQMTRSFDVLEKAAENESGGVISTAVGIGAGIGIGGQVGVMAAKTINTNPDIIPPIPTIDYYVVISGKREGPFEGNVVEQKFINGEINENTLIWKKGLKNWEMISDIEDFKHLLDENCPPPIPTI
jgi:membrane protease subunit (stomatin/prohibitin family)